VPNSLKGSQPDPLEPDDFRTYIHLNDYNNLVGGEGWRPDPFPPPLALKESFSEVRCGRIFSLFSRVMQDGLSTGPCAERPESVLSGLIFSKAVACAISVNFLQHADFIRFHRAQDSLAFDNTFALRARPASELVGKVSVNDNPQSPTATPRPVPARPERRRPPDLVDSRTSGGCVSQAPLTAHGRCRGAPSRC